MWKCIGSVCYFPVLVDSCASNKIVCNLCRVFPSRLAYWRMWNIQMSEMNSKLSFGRHNAHALQSFTSYRAVFDKLQKWILTSESLTALPVRPLEPVPLPVVVLTNFVNFSFVFFSLRRTAVPFSSCCISLKQVDSDLSKLSDSLT